MWRGDSTTLLGTAYRTFYIRGSGVVLDWHQWLQAHDGLDTNTLTATLWLEYKDSLKRKRPTRDNTMRSLASLWVSLWRDRYGDSAPREQVLTYLFAYMAQLCEGMLAEYGTVLALRDRGFDVSIADSTMEPLDIDALVNGVLVSIKCYRAFSERTVNTYRAKSSEPQLYINERLECYVPFEGRLVYRAPDRLEGVITYLSHDLVA
ncbi:hypothetical protein [Rothia sp. ND6WE1A]|uniref:hypothetical protein n=1 Tax=Rothia sp. ND6WE1A TaxID=1848190 RepID=UPI0011470AEE|nr:hypothetical protein [Rothia sp. ND6WE1A]